MKGIVFTGMLSLVAVDGAFAADLPAAPPLTPPVYRPVGPVTYDWAGIYVGLNGGYGFANSTWTSSIGTSGTIGGSGGLLGGTLGANFQVNQFVFGLESDVDYSRLESSKSSTICLVSGFVTCQTQNTWLSTVRGRAGFALDRVLFYATAGGAFGNVQPIVDGLSSSTTTRAGWTAGVGVEVAVAQWNWTAKLEYLYVDLGNASCTTACFSPPGPAFTVGLTDSLLRGGLNYKFSF
jgi:outer membrane immunogenic protein